MSLTVKHPFTSTKPDDADATLIRPSNWNAGHSLVVTAPGSGNRSVLGADNSETAVADKALFDATNPAAPGTASPGAALTAARRDHVHPAEANSIENGKTGAITPAGARTSLHVGQQAINAQTGTTYAPVTADANNIVTLSNAAAITVTLPTPTSISVNTGETVTFVKEGAGDVTYAAGADATINSPESCLRQITQFSMVFATAKSTTLWNLSGALVA